MSPEGGTQQPVGLPPDGLEQRVLDRLNQVRGRQIGFPGHAHRPAEEDEPPNGQLELRLDQYAWFYRVLRVLLCLACAALVAGVAVVSAGSTVQQSVVNGLNLAGDFKVSRQPAANGQSLPATGAPTAAPQYTLGPTSAPPPTRAPTPLPAAAGGGGAESSTVGDSGLGEAAVAELGSMAQQGVAFIGDSPVRRLYIRAIVHLEKITDSILAENLQNSLNVAKPGAERQALLDTPFYDRNTGVVGSYVGVSGPNKGMYNLQNLGCHYLTRLELLDWELLFKSWKVKFVYVGLPFLHVLYRGQEGCALPPNNCVWGQSPTADKCSWGTCRDMCNKIDIEQSLTLIVKLLQQAAAAVDVEVLVGTANTPTEHDEQQTNSNIERVFEAPNGTLASPCSHCWRNPVCTKFSLTRAGMDAANGLAVRLIDLDKFDRLHLVRFDRITASAPLSEYQGGGHWKGPVLDQKLSLLLDTRRDIVHKRLKQRLDPLSKRGILFVGDSPTRRLFVRTVVHLEGVRDELTAEAMQDDAKQLAVQQRLNSSSPSMANDENHYRGSTTSSRYDVRYLRAEELGTGWVQRVDGWNSEHTEFVEPLLSKYKTIYFGVPLLHLLYHPQWRTAICYPTFDMRASLQAILLRLSKAAQALNCTVLVGAGNMYSNNESAQTQREIAQPERLLAPRNASCVACWHKSRCEEFSQTIQGMDNANGLLADFIAKFPRLKLLRMDEITRRQPVELYLGGGHYKGLVLDQKLEEIARAAVD